MRSPRLKEKSNLASSRHELASATTPPSFFSSSLGMQGFNKYYAPDFDPNKTSSLNAYHGKHALGDRARKVSFDLPFPWFLSLHRPSSTVKWARQWRLHL